MKRCIAGKNYSSLHRGKHEAQRVRVNKLGEPSGEKAGPFTLLVVNAVDAPDGMVQIGHTIACYVLEVDPSLTTSN